MIRLVKILKRPPPAIRKQRVTSTGKTTTMAERRPLWPSSGHDAPPNDTQNCAALADANQTPNQKNTERRTPNAEPNADSKPNADRLTPSRALPMVDAIGVQDAIQQQHYTHKPNSPRRNRHRHRPTYKAKNSSIDAPRMMSTDDDDMKLLSAALP